MSKVKSIVLVGGGSGGHLTPLLAVAQKICEKHPTTHVIHIGQKNENLQEVVQSDVFSSTYQISAGKFRRYHGESFIRHVLDIKTIALNVRDFFRFLRGTVEAFFLLGRLKPHSILLKGGFVCVPVGFAARLRRIPYITHDSDAVPGLANRLTAKHALFNTTAMPAETYPYKQSKTVQVGIPIQHHYSSVSEKDMEVAKKQLGYNKNATVLLCVGGGLGAQRVNEALVRATPDLLKLQPKLQIIHVTGKKLYDETQKMYNATLSGQDQKRIKLVDFSTELHVYSMAADVVLTRAGATNIAEFSAQGKLCVVVPNPVLTGGQQLHNAAVLERYNAAIIVREDSLAKLCDVLHEVFSMPRTEKNKITKNISHLSSHDSAQLLVDMLFTNKTPKDS